MSEGTMDKTTGVRVTLKMQQSILASLVDKLGSIEAAARAIGVCDTTFSKWLNFKSQLPISGGKGKGPFGADKIKRLVLALEKETGKSVQEIFPGFNKAELALLSHKHVHECQVSPRRLTSALEKKYLTYEMDFSQVDLAERLKKVLGTLPYREREVLKLRYGIEDGFQYSLDEVAHIFKVTRERIRQIEAKALRRLQRFENSQQLVGFLD